MKLFCTCGYCGKKIILPIKAFTRQQLSNQIGNTFNLNCRKCGKTSEGNIAIVYAESSYKFANVPTLLASSGVGAFFGPIGMIIGAVVGVASGSGIKNSDKKEVNMFNKS